VTYPKVRTAYDRLKVGVYKKPGKTMTEQNHARACDINTIMAKYIKTGVLEHIKMYEPTYGDVSEADWQKSMETICNVRSEFNELPAYVRKEIGGEDKYLALMQTDKGVATLRNILAPAEKYEADGAPKVKQESAPAESDSTGTQEGEASRAVT